ncbi:hypothetical protein GCM10009716_21430 [Streptomyces sodiiphilus]|uniref:Uncharacterized protein n=1 Tax=Streptomyces sodiiphilus TaxID=226217 RepID=A0ABP5ADK2_9ACTN
MEAVTAAPMRTASIGIGRTATAARIPHVQSFVAASLGLSALWAGHSRLKTGRMPWRLAEKR